MAGIVLTGNFRPAPAVLKIVRAMPIPVLLAKQDSYEVASKVHDLTVKTRPNDAEKISLIRDLIAKNVDRGKILESRSESCPSNQTPILCLSINPTLKDLPTYQPGRPIEEVARELGMPASNIIKLASNENPLGPSPAALAAMQHVLANINLYPDGNAFYLKHKLADKLNVQPENLILGNCSNEIIEFCGPRADATGRRRGRFAILLRHLPAHRRSSSARKFSLPSPRNTTVTIYHRCLPPSPLRHASSLSPTTINPTGTVVPKQELSDFASRVPTTVLLVIDEAYIEFLDDPADFIYEIRRGERRNLLLMRTFSKIFGLAGLRLGLRHRRTRN